MEHSFRLSGTVREATAASTPLASADPHEPVVASVYVRRDPHAPKPPDVLGQAASAPRDRRYLTPEDAARVYSAAPDDMELVSAFAAEHGLEVIARDARLRSVRIRGSVSDMNAAFGIELKHFKHPDGTYRSYTDQLQLPPQLEGVVEAVLGLDNRKMVHMPRRQSTRPVPATARADQPTTLPPNTYLPPTVAQLFGVTAGDGTGECIAVFAFNGQMMSTGQAAKGGYDPAALDQYFTEVIRESTPDLVDVVVQGPGNQPGDGSDPNDATGEVLLDLCVVGSVAPNAKIAVYFTEFTEEGWVNALKQAAADATNNPSVISISYGNPEDDQQQGLWMEQTVQLVNDAMQQAASQGITISCASGDSGAGDEPNATVDHVDFPASSPWVLGVGGTRLEANSSTMTITSETVWNDLAQGCGATGGGVSRVFDVPTWQAAANVPPNADGSGKRGRGVPDVASLADPETPFAVLGPNGQLGGVGGTSAAAPLWSALIARLNQLTGARLGYMNAQLYSTLNSAVQDITTGNNGSYSAQVGWDACTGWGRPDWAKLLAALGPKPAPAPAPVPAPPPPPAPTAALSAPASNGGGPVGGAAPRLFADPQPGADETSFRVDNTSSAYYNSPYYLQQQYDIQPVPPPTATPPRIALSDVLPADVLGPITASKRIVFHAVGDTGAAKVNQNQTAARAIANEASVADSMVADLAGDDPPSFFFHLGDVVYNFGEGQYYYDQFYEPYRAYDRPIFAIPGNHDGMVFGPGTDAPQVPTLSAFLRNFCASTPAESPDACGLVRSTMTQPGVYFTLEAPFVSIIGLYTNVLDGPGVISGENGAYPLSDNQVQFLIGELTNVKQARAAGDQRAVIIACHHPPASVDATHGGTLGLSNDIDRAIAQAELWPDAVLSGHAHLYQRFTRSVDGRDIPYIVSGSGGFAATQPQASAAVGASDGEFTLVTAPVIEFGYLTVTVDMSAPPPPSGGPSGTLSIAFRSTSGAPAHDSVTVDLSSSSLVPDQAPAVMKA